jgi:GDP-4-dehydro-6-deoxy-D-mannose reductase
MRILITGVAGQDGAILSERHIRNGDQVWGSTSASSLKEPKDLQIIDNELHRPIIANKILNQIRPDRIYHLAARHFNSTNTIDINKEIKREMYACHVEITRNILNWQVTNPTTKSIVALSSQMYSQNNHETKIDEKSICTPRNYYGKTKTLAFSLIQQYRSEYNVKSYGAILFNHTSIKSKPEFLFPLLAKQMSDIIKGVSNEILLEDPDAKIDICHALEVCDGLFTLMDYEPPCDLVFASGRLTRISDLIQLTFELLEFKNSYSIIRSRGKSEDNGNLVGDNGLASKLIGWKAIKTPQEILAEQIRNILRSQKA